MTYAKFDDNFADHPKVTALSDGAFRLHVSGICYCSRYLTDGKVPVEQAPRLMPSFNPKYLRELLAAGVWLLDEDDKYDIHDYLEWNTPRAKVLAAREARREGGRKGAKRRWDGIA